ncbi:MULTISPECIES: ribonuclease P protein component [unclassified Rhodococcus (in: high G+C Gram-positive bacteria)]|uniref:ribonuclease P protein component n=1 Tax=unclassified Rhodococcus (in: high G+C Gram-positive bacteria) TaxID=192944 RepID=UPI00146DA20A|nr:ribonuclease P protein component [Rhodococcus sp. (in: high G+C Gram-positive bacteria)]MBF0663413.1 ribonuclease P protein component [Rhodococcus sp. (in: high G+C Gram-positive bacteria)]NMD95623.1 ribonuclease P protein component [Rhodococcus sp. BL-253-APC-6A1W]NME79619.1 ribonuclease P protein component [Rhodococcus sp. 105337]
MLPEPYRLRRRTDFSDTVRRGRRQGRRDLVIHALERDRSEFLVSVDGPRFGLVVNKAVGPAVIRHRVARRLRHICAGLVERVPENTDLVLRALPGSATADSRELDKQLRSGLTRLGLLLDASPTGEEPSSSVPAESAGVHADAGKPA